MSLLQPDQAAPSIKLLDDTGKQIDLGALRDRPLVLFFYPRDDTPGCTIECKEFRDARAQFQDKAHVFGISPDDEASHQAFRDKYALNFPLLSDPGHLVADGFGVWGLKPNGKEGIFRTTFVLKAGKVERVFENVKPEGHAAEVLAALA
jgi:thioredoxin-dependent peroxiredoxin